jgi:hypothetical protein
MLSVMLLLLWHGPVLGLVPARTSWWHVKLMQLWSRLLRNAEEASSGAQLPAGQDCADSENEGDRQQTST